jgi:glycerol kinase
MLMNTGDKPVYSKNNLLTTVAWKINGKTTYALEGSVFVGGAAVQWLRDGAKMINTAAEIETLAASTRQWRRLFCPCFNWFRRATLGPICQRQFWIRGTTNGHIARATLEGIAYQVYDLAKSMEADFEKKEKN